MKLVALLALLEGLAACGDPSGPSPIHAAMDPLDVAVAPPSPSKETLRLATQIDRLASELASHDLSRARDQIAAIHGMRSWTQARRASHAYVPFDPRRLDELGVAFDRSVAPLRQAATALREGHIADGVASFDATVTALMARPLHSLHPDLVDELAFDRDACKRTGCGGLGEIDVACQVVRALQVELAMTRFDGARALAKDLGAAADEHTRVVLSRAAGEGPSFGAACGPEDLCASDNSCMPATHTCEHRCVVGAMSPCADDGLHCGAVAGLTGTYCRRAP